MVETVSGRRHLEALRIYVHQLKQLPLAEAYCDRAYSARQACKRLDRMRQLYCRSSSAGSRSGAPAGAGPGKAPPWLAEGQQQGQQGHGGGSGDASAAAGAEAGGQQGGGWGANGAGTAAAAGGEDGDFDIYLLLIQASVACLKGGQGRARLCGA